MSYINDFLSSEEVQASIKSGNDWIYKDWITYPNKDTVVIDYIKIYYFLPTPELNQEMILRNYQRPDNDDFAEVPGIYSDPEHTVRLSISNYSLIHPYYANGINQYISEIVEKRKFVVLKVFYEPVDEFMKHGIKLIKNLGYDEDQCVILSGTGHRYENKIENFYNSNNKKIILYHCVNYHGWYDMLLKDNIDFFSMHCDKHFLCLSRRASIDRAKLVREMLFNFNENSIISFGFKHPKPNGRITGRCKNIIYPFNYPIYPENNHQYIHHAPPSENFYKCLINLVIESMVNHMHITEKTWKAFAWHQIPIFFGPVKIVHTLRELGFDLFDDILENHYYDQEQVTDKRIISIIRILKNFKRKYPTTDDLNKLRKEIFPRLEKNASLISYYASKESDISHMCRGTFLDDYT